MQMYVFWAYVQYLVFGYVDQGKWRGGQVWLVAWVSKKVKVELVLKWDFYFEHMSVHSMADTGRRGKWILPFWMILIRVMGRDIIHSNRAIFQCKKSLLLWLRIVEWWNMAIPMRKYEESPKLKQTIRCGKYFGNYAHLLFMYDYHKIALILME